MAEEKGHAVVTQPGRADGASAMRRDESISRLLGWRPSDPGFSALRRAARSALVIPLALAFAHFVIANPQVTTFVAFGCFALLVLGDFGGPRQPRALAYLGTTLVGSALIALGTVASISPWVGAPVMLLVGFAVSFASVFGGYVAAAQSPLLLAFVLSVAVPAPPVAIPSRLLGWGMAGVISTVAAVVLWPLFERSTLRSQAAAACHALAALVRVTRSTAVGPERAQAEQEAATAVQAVRRAYSATPSRPAGAARSDRALVGLLSELERILAYVTRPAVWTLSAQHPCLREGDVLAAEVAQTLEASGDVLTGGAPPDLVGLQKARLAHRFALDRWAAGELRAGSQAEDVLTGFDADNPLRVVALLVQALGADALVAMGRSLPEELQLPLAFPYEAGVRGAARRVGQTVRTFLHPSSSVMQNSLRVAVGLALAVLLGGVLQVAHAFWVVLGTLSALRTSALATGRTTVQALIGTVIGVAIGAPFIYAVGRDTTVLWVVYPIAVFFAAYATTVIGFVTGQVAFTLVIIVLFNLILPAGWRVGLVRLEDVALGVGISAVVGLLLWPRGLRAELRRALADLYHSVADDLAAAFNQILGVGTSEAFIQAKAQAARTTEREGEAFDQYVRERGSRHLAPEIAGALGAGGRNALVAGDLLHSLADSGYHLREPADADATFLAQVRAVTGVYAHLGDELERGTAQPSAAQQVSDAAIRTAMLNSLRRWKDDSTTEQAAVAVVAAGEWMRSLAALAADQQMSAAKVIEAARVPWWR
jgi:uncharacterized membrane protein YccC